MRKILLLAICTVVTVATFAQDIIVTRDSKRIEAKIMEVSNSEIKYKEISNLDGPTFVLSASEINTIIYKNGTVKIFDEQPQPAQNTSAQGSYTPAVKFTGAPITKSDKFYNMGDQRLTEEQYVLFIQKNCTQAYEYYMRAKKLHKTGVGLLASGLPILASGVVLYGVGVGVGTANRDSDIILGCGIPGAILMGVGSGLTVASIPCLAIGNVRKNNSHDIYNTSCARPQALQLDIKTTGNGLGLALNF